LVDAIRGLNEANTGLFLGSYSWDNNGCSFRRCTSPIKLLRISDERKV